MPMVFLAEIGGSARRSGEFRRCAFYARNGMRLAAVHADALHRSRELKPSIPSHADNGIAIRNEWEYELLLDPYGGGSDVTLQTGA
jgi:hypothetical protein